MRENAYSVTLIQEDTAWNSKQPSERQEQSVAVVQSVRTNCVYTD